VSRFAWNRPRAAERCAEEDGIILVSTDSLAEGLNLHQRCCHLIHLDLPYNPNRLEQRNGRIDRYGQRNDAEIRYLYLGGTFEERLLLRLIAKYEKEYSSNIACVYAFRGEADQAFAWLDKVLERHEGFSQMDNVFDKIHSDPRWLPFLRKIGKAPEQLAKIKFKVTLPPQWATYW